MKIVVVSQRVDFFSDRDEKRDAIDQSLTAFILRCGGLVLPVPNLLVSLGHLDNWLSLVSTDAVVLSGGNDVGTCINRDQTEHRLLDYAHDKALPVLGICRGMHMMGTWAGAGLKPVDGHINNRHYVSGRIDRFVNSYHNFSLIDVPLNFKVIAQSEDGEIEAICHKTLPWEGWMWHPERETAFSSQDVHRMSELLA